MKFICVAILFLSAVCLTSAELQCSQKELKIPKNWIDMVNPCVESMRNQIEEELKASMRYMAMGAYFSQDTVNRPGFADIFFKSASEEREHAIKLIHYLLMRGELTHDVSKLIKRNLTPATTSWANGVSALKDALELEAQVTKKIRKVIQKCEDNEKFNDYHLVDYLTGEFLEEQYKGQREIAGRISTLEKLMEKHGALGEWLFDKKLQAAE
ncbi:unnamed protein product [Acanthoscelides obtectus]|uniref:Ferritin n=2 Tax=Acanthoscelides obtectus TaxID=200917 RepID=A0A9P0Q2L8_ACAOB|nr:unnamed protein product [Acanthoscelides obtectus]CAK1664105.1 Ferritin subunit [Acanthoscelides obtectus]